jgi:hypothetical protein
VARHNEDEFWEIYSRQPWEIDEEYKRMCPLGTLLALYEDLEETLRLGVGEAVQRGGQEWLPWGFAKK